MKFIPKGKIKLVLLLCICSLLLFLGITGNLFAQDVEDAGEEMAYTDAFQSIQSWISSAYNTITSLDIPSGDYAAIEQPFVVDSTSTDLVVPSSSMASMMIMTDNSASAIVDPVPEVSVGEIEAKYPAADASSLFTPPLFEYRLAEIPISVPDRLPEPEGYRPPRPEPAPAISIMPAEQLPRPEIQAPVVQTPSNQIPSAYADAGAPAQQIQVTPLAGNPSYDTAAQVQPAFVPRQPSVVAESKENIAYGPGFNTMRSSSELYYFNRMIQKLPESERARLREHVTYTGPAVNSMAEHLPVSTRTHLGIPVDQNKVTREIHNNLYIDRDTASQVVGAWQKPENVEYRDNQDHWNAYNGYSNIN